MTESLPIGPMIELLSGNSFIRILLVAVALDTVLGVGRAIRERRFNSCVGIDGAIRKVMMIFSVVFLMLIDVIARIDVLAMVPREYVELLGIEKLGMCEFFCLTYILYESVSILKNMTLCGLPVPRRVEHFVESFLANMTGELKEDKQEKQD